MFVPFWIIAAYVILSFAATIAVWVCFREQSRNFWDMADNATRSQETTERACALAKEYEKALKQSERNLRFAEAACERWRQQAEEGVK